MADGSNSAAYEQFCLLAKAQRGRAVVALIEQVLNKDKLYVFGELLAMENVQALKGTEFESHLRLLEIFAFGTCSQYKQEENTLPSLSPKMLVKLRQLSIVTLSHQSKKVPYTALLEELSLSNVRELEDVIIDTMYAGILEGKLDQAKGFLNVTHAMARDVRMEDVRDMAGKLQALLSRMTELNSNLDNGMAAVSHTRMMEAATRTELLKEVAQLKLEGAKQSHKIKQHKSVNV